ncbi:MAG TPA: DUF6084 family protein [Pseudonocardia sp.]
MLRFACIGARPEPYAAGPSLVFDVEVSHDGVQRVHSVALRTQIRIEPRGRSYTPDETGKLADLFGAPSRWGETLNPLQFAQISTTVTGFSGSTVVPISVPLTYDLDVASTKYFHGLTADGEDGAEGSTEAGTEARAVPLVLLFSGVVYYGGLAGVQVGLVSWHEEATFRLPVSTWRAAMDAHFPASGWVRVSTRTLDALAAYRSERAIPNWDETFEHLLKEAER